MFQPLLASLLVAGIPASADDTIAGYPMVAGVSTFADIPAARLLFQAYLTFDGVLVPVINGFPAVAGIPVVVGMILCLLLKASLPLRKFTLTVQTYVNN